MYNNLKCLYIVLISICLTPAGAWETEQLEIFDLVEEINQNFYTLLNISQDADLQSVKKAFRGLSLVLHPDKSDAPDAEVQFRNLVSVYDVLKDATKREYYNEVLKNGLPNWRSAVYYYRHVRKMGLAETLATLFIVVTIGQYLVAWGAYIEKKYTAEQVYGAKLKKQQKKKGHVSADIIEKFDIAKPSFKNTLPIQIPWLIWSIITGLPSLVWFIKELIEERRQNRRLQEQEESSEEEQFERVKTARKRKPGFVLTERNDADLPPRPERVSNPKVDARTAPVITGGLWTDDDLAELIHLVKKYPGGTSERWERIAETMNRTVSEVTYMAAKMKDNCYRAPQDDKPPEDDLALKKPKTRGGKLGAAAPDDAKNPESSWSQTQQKALEGALAKHPKGPADRWDKIAKCVPDKTKEECMLRYKYLVDLVKKTKEKKETNEPDEQQ